MTGGFSGNSATLWRVPVDFKKQGYRRKPGGRAGTKTGKTIHATEMHQTGRFQVIR